MSSTSIHPAPRSPRPRDLLHGLARGAGHLLAHLADAPGGGRWFRSPSRGRALETALTLHLLRREGLRPAWQPRLVTWLEGHPADDPFTRAIVGAVLGRAGDRGADAAVAAILRDVAYARDRKHALLHALLAEVGLGPVDPSPLVIGAAAPPSFHRFARIYAAGITLLRARHQGLPIAALPESAWLRDQQGPDGSWEAQGLTTLVALLGLGRSFPACFDRGLEFLARSQRDDGGIPFCDLGIFGTAVAGLALRESGAALVPADVGDFLAARQADDGAWAFDDGVVQTDLDTATQVAQLLARLGPQRHRAPLQRAHRYLLAMQRPDGGFPTYVHAGESEVTMTANAVLALSLALPGAPALLPAIGRGLRFLPAHQRGDGSFERSWSRCETYSMFRVLWALDTARAAGVRLDRADERALAAMERRALTYLCAHQHDDGSFGAVPGAPGDALSTAYGLGALCSLRRPERAGLAAAALLARQTDDGAFPSPPDMVGPRPFVYDDPLLSTTFSVLALGLAARLAHRQPLAA